MVYLLQYQNNALKEIFNMQDTNTVLNDAIKSYLSESTYDYAILIDGAWGSGKTYYIKNTTFDKSKCSIYISLNGVASKEDFDSRIFNAVYEANLQAEGKVGKLFGGLLPTVSLPLQILAEALVGEKTSDKIEAVEKKLKECIIEYGKFYFVFDDLERCQIEVESTLGYINDFIEHKKCKVIIIANEKEIGDVGYPVIKEKVVGRTFKYIPNLNELVEGLFQTHEIFQKFQSTVYIENTITSMEYHNHANIRTLQFAIELALKLFNSIDEPELTTDSEKHSWDNIQTSLITSIVEASILFKKGDIKEEKPDSKTKDNDYQVQNLSYHFISDYVHYGIFSLSDVKNEIIENYQLLLDRDDPLSMLISAPYYHRSYADVSRDVLGLIENLRNNKYSMSKYYDILRTLLPLHTLKLVDDSCVPNIIDLMKSNIEPANNFPTFFQTTIESKTLDNWIKSLIAHNSELLLKREMDSFVPRMNVEHWGNLLQHTSGKDVNLFLKYLDDNYEEFIGKIRSSNNTNLFGLLTFLENNATRLRNTPTVVSFVEFFKSFTDEDKIKMLHIQKINSILYKIPQ